MVDLRQPLSVSTTGIPLTTGTPPSPSTERAGSVLPSDTAKCLDDLPRSRQKLTQSPNLAVRTISNALATLHNDFKENRIDAAQHQQGCANLAKAANILNGTEAMDAQVMRSVNLSEATFQLNALTPAEHANIHNDLKLQQDSGQGIKAEGKRKAEAGSIHSNQRENMLAKFGITNPGMTTPRSASPTSPVATPSSLAPAAATSSTTRVATGSEATAAEKPRSRPIGRNNANLTRDVIGRRVPEKRADGTDFPPGARSAYISRLVRVKPPVLSAAENARPTGAAIGAIGRQQAIDSTAHKAKPETPPGARFVKPVKEQGVETASEPVGTQAAVAGQNATQDANAGAASGPAEERSQQQERVQELI